mmetsp:Transcript_5616/g.10128  ORF Transcript_5616/g.10128 Transcript_5616/m.10128 type:complete len:270 (-) Transcript_5616:153-962(-)
MMRRMIGKRTCTKGEAKKKSISLRKGRNQQTDVLVSNLDKDLDDDDVLTIFEKLDYGRKIISANLTYDRNGKSLGTAIVTFKTAFDAEKCVKECDGVEVDDLEMSLKIVGGGLSTAAEKGPKVRNGMFGSAFMDGDDDYPRRSRRGGRRGGGRPTNSDMRNQSFSRGRSFKSFGGNNRRGGRGRGGSGGRGGRRGGRGGRNGRDSDKKKSAAELDKELENYMKKKSGKGGKGKGGKGGKSKEDLDAELENYAKLAAAKKGKAGENGSEE